MLLADGTGQVRRELTGLLEALVAQPRPRSAMHLRELLVRHDALSSVDRTIVLQEGRTDTLTGYSPATARLLDSFAGWHHLRRIAADRAEQAHLDAWLATGPSTRYTTRTFVVWASKARRLPALHLPHRGAASTPVLRQDERLALVAIRPRRAPDARPVSRA